jgi:hypothetical protein
MQREYGYIHVGIPQLNDTGRVRGVDPFYVIVIPFMYF